MEMSEVYIDMEACYEWEYWNPDQVDESQPYNGCPDVVEVNIHYLESTVISPTGLKSTMEHTIDGVTESAEVIISGNEIQYHIKNSTLDFTVRMKHAGTLEDAMEGMMSDDDDEEMGSDDEEMVCYDMSTHMVLYEYYDQMSCEGDGYMWVPANSGPSDDMDEMEDFGEVEVSDYTQYYNPLSATITGFAPDETGFTFSGSLNIDDAPFSYLEIHTDSTFNVLGFTMEDTEEEDNWVEFMMIHSGDTSTDETIALSALPYILLDMSDSGDGDSGDGTSWEPYYGGYCEWEGNPDDDDNVWSCKVDESDSEWENWWYYCELHDGDWFCTDDYGQSSEFANSADNDRYTNGYDGGDDGGSDDEFMCDSGETIPWDWVNDGEEDCSDGSDEWEDDGSNDWEYMGPNFYENCDDAEGLSSYDCWDNEWDIDGDGVPEDSDSYWNYECEQHTNGTWECMTDHISYYDHCENDDHPSYYECWLDEWDTDGDGNYDLGSDDYDQDECELLDDGRWACVGHEDEIEMYQNYDHCSNETGNHECWMDDWVDSEGNIVMTDGYELGDCTELENGTWDCLLVDEPEEEYHFYDNCTDDNGTYECWMDEWDYDNDGEFDESHGFDYADCSLESNGSWKCFVGYDEEDGEEEVSIYYCTPFVAQNSAGFSIFNNTNLDYSLCGTEVIDEMYEFDNSTFTMPTNLIWEDCWIEGNETVCEQGEIYYDVNTAMLWETTHENNYMDCDGDYDNNTSMCTEWIGNITDADGGAFLIESYWGDTLMMYQYDEATQSGLMISVESDDDDMDPEMIFNMFDANEDGEVNASEWADFGNLSEEGMTEDDWNEILMMIEMFDEDNSSGLNFDEFTNMMENMDDMGDDDDDMDPETMFDMFDANGDGEVTAIEWFDFTNQTDDPMSEEDFGYLSAMMDNYDVDDSGGLDFDEFMTFMSEMEDMEDSEPDLAMFMAFGLLDFAGADVNDYMVELALCDGESLLDLECEDSVYSRVLADIMYSSEEEAMMALMTDSMVFMDSDGSGTLTNGDFVMINKDNLDVDGEWNFARLHSTEAGAYSDENPMMGMLPGFTGFIATIGLLSAALIRRE
jgi:Ca2+-binding EF-hand superfamily protein